uniref:(California timema) hypothetical protein n=1 Tax=Timema californicum TaxID=61474 RepID=A0A7R9J8X8_TIMCA|nr:unnamed protein product [Timema californicum]
MDTSSIDFINKEEHKKKTMDLEGPANFETAISYTGFGKFNILVVLVSVIGMCCNMLDTSALSFILPSAECDLGLSSSNKGILNAITYADRIEPNPPYFGESLPGSPDRIEPNPPYFGESLPGSPDRIEPNPPYFGESLPGSPDRIEPNPPYFGDPVPIPGGPEVNDRLSDRDETRGMVCSSGMWGFLSDSFGRWRILVNGYILNGVICVLSSLSQSYEVLLVLRFLVGFVGFGPFAVLATYVAEVHAAPYRASAVMFLGIAFGAMNLLIPGK